jgi:uncharacterized protein (DUF3084 family)
MKKFILALIVLLTVQLNGFSQTGYPKFETDSLGQQVVVLTIEQAQALDNNTDLLLLFEKLNSQIGDYDSMCLKVVGEKDKVIATQTIQIGKLKESLLNKDEQIVNLQKTISKNEEKVTSLELTLKNKDEEISLHKNEIKRVKRKLVIGGLTGGAAIIGLIFMLISLH